MLGWRVSGTLLMLLLGCGETTQRGEPETTGGRATSGSAANGSATNGAAASGSATGGGATGGGGTTGGKGGEETTKPQPGAGAGAVAGSAGEGGRGPCAGIEPRCEPGEQACDPRLGKLGTCDACGVVTNVDESGVDCVRLLASDKESNGVCAVLGRDRLECWPELFEVRKTTLPRDIVEVLLPDDYPSGSQLEPCLHDSANSYSCGLVGCNGRVVVGDTGMCSLCHGEVFCDRVRAQPWPVERPIDIDLTDGEAFVLSPLGVHTVGDTRLPLPSGWRGAPAQLLVDHQLAGCVISDQRELACWLTLATGFHPASWQGRFKKIIASTLPRACALDDARQLRCGSVFEDVAPAAYGDADTIDFVASASTVCSLSVAGHVKCWNAETGDARTVAPGW